MISYWIFSDFDDNHCRIEEHETVNPGMTTLECSCGWFDYGLKVYENPPYYYSGRVGNAEDHACRYHLNREPLKYEWDKKEV